MWELPDFAGRGGTGHASGALGQHDSELLLSYLTVPYLRIPLVMSFFASDDRIHALQSRKLQALLDATLFEPGNHLPLSSAGLEPVDVPTSAPTLLGTPHHLLLNELSRSPDTVVDAALKLARQACDLDTGTLFSSTATVILYVARLCSRLDNFVSLCLDYDAQKHESIVGKPFRGLELGMDVRPRLEQARTDLRAVMWGDLRRILLTWYHRLVLECDSAESDLVLDINTRHMCNLHAHLLLMLRNASATDLTEPLVSTVACAMVFLSTRHEWNHDQLDKTAAAQTPWAGWRVPENELFEALHVLRRKLVMWLRSRSSQSELDAVMDRVLRVSASTGSLLPAANEEIGRWAYVEGERSLGRFTRHSIRNGAAAARPSDATQSLPADGEKAQLVDDSGEDVVSEKSSDSGGTGIMMMSDDGQLAVEVDVQMMQLTLKAAHPQALPDEIAQLPDVTTVFGDVSMQACLTEQSALRSCYRIVGRLHDIEYWGGKDENLPQLDHFRAYYPEELYPSEKVWLPSVLEPVKQAYLTFPTPLQIFLPEEPLPEDAQVAYLVGKQPDQSGVWREIFVYRARKMVQIYRIESHGRRFYRSLEYTTDARFTLRSMQPTIEHRNTPWPSWGRHEAGHPYATSYNKTASAVITRDWTVDANLSLGTETYLPARLLYGLIPQVLLEEYDFWQDESDQLRGYPKSDATERKDDVLLVRIGQGGHVSTFGARFDKVRANDHALAPARTLVLRVKAGRLESQRDDVMAALECVERLLRGAEILEGAFEPSFATCNALLALISAMKNQDGGEDEAVTITSRLERLFERLDLAPFKRRRSHHRTAAAVLPALIDAATELLAAGHSVVDDVDTLNQAATVEETAAPTDGAASASEVDARELVLLDLLHAPEGSYLASLATLIARIENLSHVLAWARFDDKADLRVPSSVSHEDLYVVALPRLKLTFQARHVGDAVRLFSVDHADLFVTNDRSSETTELLAGIPHALLLSNSNGEISVLVPSVPPVRPRISSVPFSTELVLDRLDAKWYHALENPYYVYPVHVSLCFLYSTTLASVRAHGSTIGDAAIPCARLHHPDLSPTPHCTLVSSDH